MNFPTFGRADYNPREVTTDGPFTASRAWLHVQKGMIGVTVYAIARAMLAGLGLSADPAAFYAALIGGPGTLCASITLERIHRTDPNPHTLAEHLEDWFTDGALYSAGFVLATMAGGRWLEAIALAGVLFLIYRTFRNGARP